MIKPLQLILVQKSHMPKLQHTDSQKIWYI